MFVKNHKWCDNDSKKKKEINKWCDKPNTLPLLSWLLSASLTIKPKIMKLPFKDFD